jgi:hypothetical protein
MVAAAAVVVTAVLVLALVRVLASQRPTPPMPTPTSTATSTATPTATPARHASARPGLGPDQRPCLTVSGITQTSSGRIDGCLAVGNLRPGRHALTLRERVFTGPTTVGRSWRGPSVRVSLSPSSGPPGTVVTIRGSLARAVPRATRRHLIALGRDVLGVVSWDGTDGLMLDAERFRWTSRRSFTAVVVVPSAPWIERTRTPAVLGLRSGSYPIAVTCITNSGGCAYAAEGSASFRLRVAHPISWCKAPDACARLRAYPDNAAAGALVRVSGYAPLLEFDDGGDSFLGTAAITRGAGGRRGVRFVKGPRLRVTERLGPAPLVVLGRPYLEQLGRIRPRATLAGGPTPIAADPSDPHTVAWCGSGVIDVSVDGRLTRVSTATAVGALRRLHGLAVVQGAASPPSCTDVMPLSATTVLAAFTGGLRRFQDVIPPIAYYALETRDGGRTWMTLPVPRGTDPAEFGGFRSTGRDAEAVFARPVAPDESPDATHPLAERSGDGGASWTPVTFGCARVGACVTFGPFLPGNCAQGLSTQYVLRSDDRGRSWRQSPIFDANAFACGDAQLASLGGRTQLLVNAISPHPLQLSTDGGVSWQNLSMPAPARLETPSVTSIYDFGPGGITLLRNGALLLTGGGAYRGGWQLLEPRAREWCDVAGASGTWQFAPQASRLTPIGDRLWWLTYGRSHGNWPTPIELHTLPLAAIRCA